jgi:limonene-1,2-epoxide hydrolase
MSDSVEVVVRAFVDAINRQDVEGLAGMMTPGHRFVDSMGGVTEGRDKMRAGWVGYFRMVPDYEIVVEEIYYGGKHGTAGPSTPFAALQSLRMTSKTNTKTTAGPSTTSAKADSAQDDKLSVVVMLGKARGTYSTDGTLKAENRWETPAAWRAVVEGGLVAEWRVYADNEPMRELMRRAG